MKGSLFARALGKFGAGFLLTGLLLFVPAGSLHWWNGWLFIALLFAPMFIAGLVMLAKNPALLEKRLNAKEEQGAQKRVVATSAVMFIAGFVLAGLDARFHWTNMPRGASVAAAAVFLIAYALYAEVLRENTWLSRTIEVQDGQQVVDTGLYGIVRHPMYAVTLLLFLSMPLVLGSIPALIAFLIYPVVIVRRILNEEQVLRQGLPGYEAYTQKVRWRLIPGIW